MNELNQLLIKMVNVAKNINDIYYDVENFHQELQQTYLDMSIEYENELFSEIDDIKQSKNISIKDLVNKYYLLLMSKNLDNEIVETLFNRFFSYYAYQEYHLPFVSNKKNKQKSDKENEEKIIYQIEEAFINNCFVLYSENLEKASTIDEKQEIIFSLNCILSQNKYIELSKPVKLKSENKIIKLLTDLGHSDSSVKGIFEIFKMTEVVNITLNCIDFTDDILEDPYQQILFKMLLIRQEAVLSLCNQDEKDELKSIIYRNIIDNQENKISIKNSSQSINSIMMLLSGEEQNQKKEKNIKIKKTSEKI